MERYNLILVNGRWYVQDRNNGFDKPRYVTTSRTPALNHTEASIIYFALNTIANGGQLIAIEPYKCECGSSHSPRTTTYSGPTKGVANDVELSSST